MGGGGTKLFESYDLRWRTGQRAEREVGGGEEEGKEWTFTDVIFPREETTGKQEGREGRERGRRGEGREESIGRGEGGRERRVKGRPAQKG